MHAGLASAKRLCIYRTDVEGVELIVFGLRGRSLVKKI